MSRPLIDLSSTNWKGYKPAQKLAYLRALRRLPAIDPVTDDHEPFLPWCQQSRHIRDRRDGRAVPFSLRDYPWLEFPYAVVGALPPRGELILRKCAQVGFTELAINLAFWSIAGGASVFYALPPGKGIAGDFAHARIDTAIADSPAIAAMVSDIDNVGLKLFDNGTLYIRSTYIPGGDPRKAPGLAEVPADLAIFDEFDKIPPAAVPLVRERLTASYRRWVVMGSTPTYPDVGIDRAYQDTCQHEVEIRCQSCGVWHWLTWELVRGPMAGDPHARLICPACGHEMERVGMWTEGRARWTARRPDLGVLGFWVNRLVDPGAVLDELWTASTKRDEISQQAFHNGQMGIPYEPKGARLTRDLIAACVNPGYTDFERSGTWTAMGVDVGLRLHVWIMRRTPEGRQRAVWIGDLPLDWHELDTLMHVYGVQRCVVDDRPELTADVAFQKRHPGKVVLAQEGDHPDAPLARFKRKVGVVLVERTKGLSQVTDSIRLGLDELPTTWETVDGLPEHLTAVVKAMRVMEDGRTVYHFPQTSKVDHLLHAKGFAEIALGMLPPDPGGPRERTSAGSVPAAGRPRLPRSKPNV